MEMNDKVTYVTFKMIIGILMRIKSSPKGWKTCQLLCTGKSSATERVGEDVGI